VPAVDFPRIASLYLGDRLPLDRLIGRTRPLHEANEALADLESAIGLRTILE
jgi:S-(hydroxymethyl)glutathione dehydrogenase/alcohol dehydrogenase